MIKAISIQLAFVVLMGSVIDFHDIAKVPYLIDHYHQHKSKDSAFSLIEFFNMHYGSLAEKHDKEEHEQHKGLPFKAPDNVTIHSTVFLTEPHNTSIELEAIEVTYTNFYQPNSYSEFSPTIFQPPRIG